MNDLYYTNWDSNDVYKILTTSSYNSYTTSGWATIANTNSYYYNFNSSPTLKDILQEGNSYHLEYCFSKLWEKKQEKKDRTVILLDEIEKDTIAYTRLDFGIKYKNGVEKTTNKVSRRWLTDYLKDFEISSNRYIYEATNSLPSFYVIGGNFVPKAINKFFSEKIRYSLKEKTYHYTFTNEQLIYVVYNDELHTVYNSQENRELVEKNFKHLTFKISPYFKNYEKGGNVWLAHYIYTILRASAYWEVIKMYGEFILHRENSPKSIEEMFVKSLEEAHHISYGHDLDYNFFQIFINALERKLLLTRNTISKDAVVKINEAFNDVVFDINII